MLRKLSSWLFADPAGLAPWRAHVVQDAHPTIPSATLLAQGKWVVRGKVQHFRTYRDWGGRVVKEVSDDGKIWKEKT